jgi:hypothetical protein
MTHILWTRLWSLALLGFLAPAAPPAQSKLPLSLEAIAINLSNVGPTGPTRVEMKIERWSTDEERDKLRDALIEKGPEALMTALQRVKPRVGYIRTTTSLAWDIQYARETLLPSGSRRIVFATDRPMSFVEAAQNLRSAEYDFMLAELRIGPDGKGEGKLVPRAKVSYNKDTRTIEIEDYASQPVRLSEVRVSGH